MSEALILRRSLEADLKAGLADRAKLGPAPAIVEYISVPGKARPAKVTFRLVRRQGHWLEYAAKCPRCHRGVISAETEMGANARTIWPPLKGFATLCEAICESEEVPLVQRDDIWNAAHAQAREQRRRFQ